MSWTRLMRDTIEARPLAGLDQYAQPTYGGAATAAAMVQRTSDVIATADGIEVQATHKIATSIELKVGDQVKLPSESTWRSVIGVESAQALSDRSRLTIAMVS